MSFSKNIALQTIKILDKENPNETDLNNAFRLLAKWRQLLITNTQIQKHGNVVAAGPFAGLKFIPNTSEGCQMPRLTGAYEHELHSTVERLAKVKFGQILNIGCADGFYAVGLARKIPKIPVFAHDTNEIAQQKCRLVSEMNEVSERITIGGLFEGERFKEFANKKTWLIMDIEGGEDALLRPDLYPELKKMTILVESHDCFIPNLSTTITQRFSATHKVTLIRNQLAAHPLPEWLDSKGHLDQLTAMWEWRMGPTPWLVMEPK